MYPNLFRDTSEQRGNESKIHLEILENNQVRGTYVCTMCYYVICDVYEMLHVCTCVKE